MPRTVYTPGFRIPLHNVPDEMSDEEAVTSAMRAGFPVLESQPERLESMGAQIKGGGEVAPGEVTGELGETSFGGLASRFQASTANLLTEKASIITARIPGSKIQIVQDPNTFQPIILVKLPQHDKYLEFDSSGFFSLGDTMDAMGGLMNARNLAMLAVGMAGPSGAGPAAMFARPLLQAGAAAAGTMAQSELQRMLGGEEETREEVLYGQAIPDALIGGGTAAALEPFGLLAKGGRALAGAAEDVAALSEEARALGFEGLTIGEAHPVFKTMYLQATRTSRGARNWALDRLHNDAANITRDINMTFPEGLEGAPARQIHDTLKRWQKALQDDVNAPINTNFLTSGKAAAEGLQTFQRVADAEIGNLEAAARAAAEAPGLAKDVVRFNLRDAQEAAVKVKTGIRGRLLPEAAEEVAMLPERVSQATTRLDPLPREARDIANQLINMNPNVELFRMQGGATMNPYDQMVELRRRAHALAANPSTARYGKPLYDAIVEAMKNPVGGNQRFINALKRVNDTRGMVESLLDDIQGRELLRMSERPEQFGRELISPDAPDRTRRAHGLMEAGRPGSWDIARGGYFRKLTQDPANIERELDKWLEHPEAFRRLMNPAEENALRQYGRAWQSTNMAAVKRLFEEQDRLGLEGMNIILNGTPAQLRALVNETGGKDNPLGRALRAGIKKQLIDGATKVKEGRTVIQTNRVANTIGDLKKTGKLEAVMTPQEIKDLDVMARYFSYIPDEAGMAEGLQAASLGPKFFGIPFSPSQLKATLTLTKNSIMARIMMSPKWRSKLMGRESFAGRERLRSAAEEMDDLQAIGPMLPLVVRDWERDAAALYGVNPPPHPIDPQVEQENQRLRELIWGPSPD